MKEKIFFDNIKEAYKQNKNYAETGRIFNLSRQRVYQIVTGYKNTGFHGREELYIKSFKLLCEGCSSARSVHLHHKDGNNQNDTTENLISLCKKCHLYAHIYLRNGVRCKTCLRPFTETKHCGLGYCTACYLYQKFLPKKRGRNVSRQIIKQTFKCTDCGETSKHRAKKRCRRCYYRYLYKTNPVRREYHKNYNETHKHITISA